MSFSLPLALSFPVKHNISPYLKKRLFEADVASVAFFFGGGDFSAAGGFESLLWKTHTRLSVFNAFLCFLLLNFQVRSYASTARFAFDFDPENQKRVRILRALPATLTTRTSENTYYRIYQPNFLPPVINGVRVDFLEP